MKKSRIADFETDRGFIKIDYNYYCDRATSKEDIAEIERELIETQFTIQDLISGLKEQYKKFDKKEGK